MPSGGARPGSGRKPKPIGDTARKLKAREKSRLKRGTVASGRPLLTQENIELLRASPHVRNVTPKTVSFTGEFKEMFWQECCAGVQPARVFRNVGIDPDILGSSRVYGLVRSIRESRETPPADRSAGSITVGREELERLRHEVAYLSQQMDFLKKIIAAGNSGKSK